MDTSEMGLFADLHVFDTMTTKQVQIIRAAIDVFADKGYANSSTHEIAKRAHVAEGNIFAKFGSKRGLLRAIIDPVIQSIFPQTIDGFLREDFRADYATLDEFINAMVRNRIDLVRNNKKVLKAFLSEIIYNSDNWDRLKQEMPQGYWTRMYTLFDRLKAAGELVDWPDQDIARVLWSNFGGMLAGYFFFDQKLDDPSVAIMVASLVKALRP
ncbi:TetR/AcrR family transcriptional regulator [Lacticaseibacillus zhaodongensis]|uniref:TetR/AcrR family transcriptional regulator n=1 Tax=Lacticaseibacillus zhaodongensis TaxID=2668065 RepID=UPI0012D3362C|nr:TetR/AcrR family transcriptional regulator [Lacticaseibacillus zhaodongensis]